MKETVNSLIVEVRDHAIPIYISDNSIDNRTETIIQELQKNYEYIYYYRNREDVGHDKNSFFVAQLPDSDYVWLYGDSLMLKAGAVNRMLNIFSIYEPNVVSVNAIGRNLDRVPRLYTDHNSVLDDLGWHVTLTGATIYSREIITSIKNVDMDNFKNFPQLSLIFDNLVTNCSFYWENTKWICASPDKKGYWVDTMFKIFIHDWSAAIRNLSSSYRENIKEKVIIEHSIKSDIFSLRALLKARLLGAYNINVFRQYKTDLIRHSPLPSFILLVLAVSPKLLLKFLSGLKNVFK